MTSIYTSEPRRYRSVESLNGKTGSVTIKSSDTITVENNDYGIISHATSEPPGPTDEYVLKVNEEELDISAHDRFGLTCDTSSVTLSPNKLSLDNTDAEGSIELQASYIYVDGKLVVNGDTKLEFGKKLLGTDDDGNEHNLISINDSPTEYIDVGSTTVPLYLNHKTVPGKHIEMNLKDANGNTLTTEEVAVGLAQTQSH
jgi:hypothetical protein